MLHLFVPQSITSLIWAYLVLSSTQSPHAFCTILAFSMHSFIFLFSQQLARPTLLCLFIKIRHDTHTRVFK